MKLTEMIRNFFRWNRKVTNNESKTGQKRRIENKTEKLLHSKGNQKKKNKNKTMVQEQEASEALQNYLLMQYDFRYNLLTEETEFRPNSSSDPAFTPIGQREMNTLCMDARTIGIKCWDRDLNRYLLSTRIPSYHPLQLYMKELPE